MDIGYLVRGFLTPSDKEKRVLYVGQSPKEAFDFFGRYSAKAEIVVEIWENGCWIKDIKS